MMPSDVKTIVDNLEDFIEVPDGIERLKKAVLTLGISGKLVPQNLTEGTGDDLYNEMTKAVLRSKNKTKIIPTITSEEIPFKIPETWKWVRLGEVTNYGQTEKSDLSNIIPGTWILELEDLEKNGGRLLSMIEYPQRKPGSDKNIFKKGDVLFGKLRPYLNKVIVADRDGIASSELLPIRWNVPAVPEYLRIVLLSDYFFTYVNQKTYGVKMPRLGTDDGKNSLIPLPPLAEQKRIIERFEEVINQIKVLEIKKQERDDIRKRLTRNAMHSLELGDTKIALANLADLVKSTDDLKELERSIITLGISGKLVPQDLVEGTANDLFIRVQNIRSVIRGRKGKENTMEIVAVNEVPFLIPTSWKWVRLGELGETQTGTTPKNGDVQSYGNDFPFIKPADISADNINYENKGLSEYGIEKYGRMAPARSSLMVCIGTIGKTNIIQRDCSFNQQINSITPYECLDSNFVQLVLRSSYFQKEAWNRSSRTTLAILNKGKWEKIPFPLPPLIEQNRIVKKIEEIMDIINPLRLVLLG
jgi:type I restriction enzyme S subunit